MYAEDNKGRRQQNKPGKMIVPRLPERSRQVVKFTAVMNNMGRPEPTHAMGRAMFPVIEKILRYERKQNYRQAHTPIENFKLPSPHQNCEAYKTHCYVGNKISQPHHH